MVDHLLYCIDSTRIMKKHRTPVIKFDKKGNPRTEYIPLVRYVDSRDGKIYTLNEYGKLIGEDGTEIKMNGEKIARSTDDDNDGR